MSRAIQCILISINYSYVYLMPLQASLALNFLCKEIVLSELNLLCFAKVNGGDWL